MRLKFLLNIGSKDKDPQTDVPTGLPMYLEGQVVEIGDDKEFAKGQKLSEYLIKRGIVEQTDDDVTPVKSEATPTKQAVLKAQPTGGNVGGHEVKVPAAAHTTPAHGRDKA